MQALAAVAPGNNQRLWPDTYNGPMRSQILLTLCSAFVVLSAHAGAKSICVDYASRVPNLKPAQCDAVQLRDMGARSVQGRSIWGRDITQGEGRLRVLVLGGIHGDEMSSVATVFHWINFAAQPSADLPMGAQWRFIPALNPDGLFAHPSRRVNANGVDLNRNFPTPNWERDARNYWEVRTQRDPRRWPGRRPLSEPESRFLNEQLASFKPNLIVSVHAPFGLLDFDGPSEPPRRLGRLYLDQVGVYPGSLGNYGGIQKRVPVVTVELPSASRTPQDGDIRQMWDDLQRWTGQRLGPSLVATNESP